MNNLLSSVAFTLEGNTIEFTVSYMRDWEAILTLAVDSYNLGDVEGNEINLTNVETDVVNDPIATFETESDANAFALVLESMGAFTSDDL